MADYTVSADLEVNDKASTQLDDIGAAARRTSAELEEAARRAAEAAEAEARAQEEAAEAARKKEAILASLTDAEKEAAAATIKARDALQEQAQALGLSAGELARLRQAQQQAAQSAEAMRVAAEAAAQAESDAAVRAADALAKKEAALSRLTTAEREAIDALKASRQALEEEAAAAGISAGELARLKQTQAQATQSAEAMAKAAQQAADAEAAAVAASAETAQKKEAVLSRLTAAEREAIDELKKAKQALEEEAAAAGISAGELSRLKQQQAAAAAEAAAMAAHTTTSADRLHKLGQVGGETESILRGLGGVVGMVSPELAGMLGVAAELGGGLEATGKAARLAQSQFGAMGTALLAAGGGFAILVGGLGVAAGAMIGTVAAADDLAKSMEHLKGIEGFGFDKADVAALETANAAMGSIAEVSKRLVVLLGVEFAPVVEDVARALVKMGLVAGDVFEAFLSGRDVLAEFASFVGREVVQALLAPVDAMVALIEQTAQLAGVLGASEIQAQLDGITKQWDDFATDVAKKGADAVGGIMGAAADYVGIELDGLDARADALIAKVRAQQTGSGGGDGGERAAFVAAAQATGAGGSDPVQLATAKLNEFVQEMTRLGVAAQEVQPALTVLASEVQRAADEQAKASYEITKALALEQEARAKQSQATLDAIALVNPTLTEQELAYQRTTIELNKLASALGQAALAGDVTAEEFERTSQTLEAARVLAEQKRTGTDSATLKEAADTKADQGAQAVAGALTGSLAATLAPMLSALGPQGAIAGAVLSLLEQGPEVVQEVLMAIPESIGKIVESVGALPDMIPGLVTSLIEVLPGVLITLLLQQSGIMAVQLVAALVESLPEIIESTIEAMIELLTQLPLILVELLDIPGLLLATSRALPGMLFDAAKMAGPILADAIKLAALDVKDALIREIKQVLRDLNPFSEGRAEKMRDAFKIDLRADLRMDGRKVAEALDLARDRRRGGA